MQYDLPSRSPEASSSLIKEITSNEIKSTILSMNSNSASRPDGFNAHV